MGGCICGFRLVGLIMTASILLPGRQLEWLLGKKVENTYDFLINSHIIVIWGQNVIILDPLASGLLTVCMFRCNV